MYSLSLSRMAVTNLTSRYGSIHNEKPNLGFSVGVARPRLRLWCMAHPPTPPSPPDLPRDVVMKLRDCWEDRQAGLRTERGVEATLVVAWAVTGPVLRDVPAGETSPASHRRETASGRTVVPKQNSVERKTQEGIARALGRQGSLHQGCTKVLARGRPTSWLNGNEESLSILKSAVGARQVGTP